MELTALGKIFFQAGLVLSGVGALLWIFGKAGLSLGSLPGDFQIERAGFSVHVPLATCLILSILLTLGLNLLLRFWGK